MSGPDRFGDGGWHRLFDPTGLFPAEGLRTVDLRAREVLRALDGEAEATQLRLFPAEPSARGYHAGFARTRDVIQFDHHYDPAGEDLDFISLVVTADHLEVRLPVYETSDGCWEPTLSTVAWVRRAFEALAGPALSAFLAGAVAEQRSRFLACDACGARIGPGQQVHVAGGEPLCRMCSALNHNIWL